MPRSAWLARAAALATLASTAANPSCGTAGYYCAPGSVEPSPCGSPAVYCPPRSRAPVPVSRGYYSIVNGAASSAASDLAPLGTETVRTGELACPRGSYCVGGVRTACPAGRFGDVPGLFDETCSGPCAAGFFCPAGSVSARARPCGHAGVVCGPGAAAPTVVPPGFYSVSATASGESVVEYLSPSPPGLAIALPTTLDVAAASAGVATRVATRQCPAGAYCEGDGVARLCPAGRFGAAAGQSDAACSGLCASGFFCPPGSVSPTQFECGDESVYCPEGSGAPLRVPAGAYSSGGRAGTPVGNPPVDVPQARGAPGGVAPLGAGAFTCDRTYGLDDAHAPSGARAAAPGESDACVEGGGGVGGGASAAAGCSAVPRSPLLYPPGAPLLALTRRRACVGGSLGSPATRSVAVACEAGAFCVAGLRYECPPGRYGSRARETSPACEGACRAGYACAWGSAAPDAAPCGPGRTRAPLAPASVPDPAAVAVGVELPLLPLTRAAAVFYCPAASGAPAPVDVGFFVPIDEPPNAATRQVPCPAGSFCPGDGWSYPCPAGVFGGAPRLATRGCSGPCEAGYYCPVGSTSARERPCGGTSLYCPPGSPLPSRAPDGYYTVGGVDDAANATRTGIVRCEASFYCVGGVKRQCAAGAWGASPGAAAPSCDGPCAPGHFCPPGSTSSTPFRCGDVKLFLVDVLAGVAARAALQDNKFNSSDDVTQVDAAYDARALFSAYAELVDDLADGAPLAGESALPGASDLGSGLAGAAGTGAWRARWRGAVDASSPNGTALPLAAEAAALPRFADSVNADGEGTAGVPYAEDAPAPGLVLRLLPPAGARGLRDVALTLPWRAGVRFRQPSLTVAIESVAASARALLVAGAAGVYCPRGTGWPVNVPPGYVSTTSDAALRAAYGLAGGLDAARGGYNTTALAGAALLAYLTANSTAYAADAGARGGGVGGGIGGPPVPAIGGNTSDPDAPWLNAWPGYGQWPGYAARGGADANGTAATGAGPDARALAAWTTADARNHTRDAVAPAPPGAWAAGGVAHPCAAGTFSADAGRAAPCAAPCPAGFACPQGSRAPAPCAEGTYAPAGSPRCLACPGARAPGALEPTNEEASGEDSAGPPPPPAREDAYAGEPAGAGDARAAAAARAARSPARPRLDVEVGAGGDAGALPSTPRGMARCRTARACCGL